MNFTGHQNQVNNYMITICYEISYSWNRLNSLQKQIWNREGGERVFTAAVKIIMCCYQAFESHCPGIISISWYYYYHHFWSSDITFNKWKHSTIIQTSCNLCKRWRVFTVESVPVRGLDDDVYSLIITVFCFCCSSNKNTMFSSLSLRLFLQATMSIQPRHYLLMFSCLSVKWRQQP